MKVAIKPAVLVGVLILIMVGLFLYFGFGFSVPKKQLSGNETLPSSGSRLLIIAPHCDDETLGAGIVINRALKAHCKVKVVLVTNGDGFTMAVNENFFTLHPSSKQYRRFGIQRQIESLTALKKLGLKESDVIFLGYPDAGIAQLWTEFWDPEKRYFSRFTQTNISPYKDSFDKYATYTGTSLLADFETIIDEYKPTDIYFPHPNDQHPDHWGVNAFVKYLLELKQLSTVKEHLYIVHRGNWPRPRVPRPNQRLTPPSELTGLGTKWRQLEFQSGEAKLKKTAILQYKTQIRVIKSFLMAFVRSSELFGQYSDIKIPVQSKLEIDANKNSLLIKDPEGDLITADMEKAGDITGIYSYVAGGKWILELSTASAIQQNIVYRMNARLFPVKGPVRRLDIVYDRGKMELKKPAKNSMTMIQGLRSDMVKGRWRLMIPMEQMKDIHAVFLNADSSIEHFNVDKTAWRMLRFQ